MPLPALCGLMSDRSQFVHSDPDPPDRRNTPALLASLPLILGIIVFVCGFAAPYWLAVGTSAHGGLWETCKVESALQTCVSHTPSWSIENGLFRVQLIEVAALMSMLSSLIFLVAAQFATLNKNPMLLPICALPGCLGAAVGSITGAVLYFRQLSGANSSDFIGWAFYVTLVGGLVVASAGLVVVCGVCAAKKK